MVESVVQKPCFQVKCWNYGGENYVIDYPNERNNHEVILYNVQEAFIVGDVGRNVPMLCVALSNQQEEHQAPRTEVEGRTRLG